MNLAEALNAALPDLPAQKARVGYPKVDPGLIWHENTDDGEPIIVAMIRGRDSFFRFPPDQWKIIELFDGKRSWEDVADLYAELYGTRFDPDDLREFTSGLDAIDFWYKTPFEKNIALQQKLEEGRHKHAHKKSKWGDVAHMQFSAWDPDKYFNRIYPWLKWLYSRWFGMICLALFGFMIYVFAANWGQIAQDSILFYNFTQKTAADLAEFWILFLILAFFHESSHGLTCKHYGGQVHAMGFHLIYLTPAFFVDVSEAFVYAGRWQRFLIILAGIGVEMIFCAFATIVWWGTPPGSPAHDLAYKIMLITGVAVVVVNMNPLIKLDGYYAFSEIIGFSDIKERSTAYLSGLVRKHIFRLPVEMDFVPRRRRPGYLAYAVLSGLYSYMLLITVLRFSDHVLARFLPQWAFIPVLALGILIFRSRIKTLVRFLRTVYLDKRDRVRALLTLPVMVVGTAVLLAVVFVPMWHETITARFLLEPARQALVRSTVPGRVTAVLAREGEQVRAGDPLVTMTNADVDADRASAQEKRGHDRRSARAGIAHAWRRGRSGAAAYGRGESLRHRRRRDGATGDARADRWRGDGDPDQGPRRQLSRRRDDHYCRGRYARDARAGLRAGVCGGRCAARSAGEPAGGWNVRAAPRKGRLRRDGCRRGASGRRDHQANPGRRAPQRLHRRRSRGE